MTEIILMNNWLGKVFSIWKIFLMLKNQLLISLINHKL